METKGVKKKNKKIVISLIIVLISFSLLVYSTLAWFTDTATVKGNKIFAGNLNVDVITDFDGLKEAGYIEQGVTEESFLDGVINGSDTTVTISVEGVDTELEVYTKTYQDDSKEYYFILTDVETPFVKLYNVEPGQAFPVKFSVLNSGDLTIKYTAGFQISKDEDGQLRSYTGLETLKKQYDGTFGTYHNKYLVNDGSITNNRVETYELNNSLEGNDDEYTERLNRLKKKQWDETKPIGSQDIGGHLEDVLEVYAVDKYSFDSSGNPTRSAIKQSNLIGTVKQVMDVFDPTVENVGELADVESRINHVSQGYCLPSETLIDENGKYAKDVKAFIYAIDNLGEPVKYRERKNVTNMGNVQYIIYMPEDVDNIYQNASLFLDMGVTGSQAEFEFDGLNYMIYDADGDHDIINDVYSILYDAPFNENLVFSHFKARSNYWEEGLVYTDMEEDHIYSANEQGEYETIVDTLNIGGIDYVMLDRNSPSNVAKFNVLLSHIPMYSLSLFHSLISHEELINRMKSLTTFDISDYNDIYVTTYESWDELTSEDDFYIMELLVGGGEGGLLHMNKDNFRANHPDLCKLFNDIFQNILIKIDDPIDIDPIKGYMTAYIPYAFVDE